MNNKGISIVNKFIKPQQISHQPDSCLGVIKKFCYPSVDILKEENTSELVLNKIRPIHLSGKEIIKKEEASKLVNHYGQLPSESSCNRNLINEFNRVIKANTPSSIINSAFQEKIEATQPPSGFYR